VKKFCHDWLPEIKLQSVTNESSGKRTYATPEGQTYPSVTTVLSEHGREAIAAWRNRIGAAEANRISNSAARRGTRVHKLAERYIKNEEIVLDNPLHQDLFDRIRPHLDEIDNIRASEYNLYSDYLRLAGTVDCIADYKGKPHIIDFKTSSKPKQRDWIHSYFMQASAYAIMAEERYGLTIPRLAIIIAVEDSDPQVFVEHRDDWAELLIEYRDLYEKRS
jgi:ATP-dependent exoDNAse (exonuclease V) beta subunit